MRLHTKCLAITVIMSAIAIFILTKSINVLRGIPRDSDAATCNITNMDPVESVAAAKLLFSPNMTLEDIDKLAAEFASRVVCSPDRPRSDREKLIIIVPYRDRKRDLLAFLLHMTPYLKIKDVQYEILVAEQHGSRPFNRAKLFNAALSEIFKANVNDRLAGGDCYAFHDVDKLPMLMTTPYKCLFRPHQLLRYVKYKNGGKIMYDTLLGGVTLFRRPHIEAMNGASNSFEGWGGEDDDLYNRVRFIHFQPRRVPYADGLFYEEDGDSHVRHKSPRRFEILAESSPQRMELDGLRQVTYSLNRRRDYKNFIWMYFII
ncbi:unnamed protein product [Mesocestoides corti]|uniref:Beta-1,4-galactosyltransferase n=1 Tax=Mesocestoides corti TaxID=53468 RepID=A0A0R3U5A9_MESCO|nr:unnamed protein product [Mesocestoides corti]